MSCEGFFDQYVRWAEDDPAHHLVGFRLVSNQENGVCSYAWGTFRYRPSGGTGGPLGISLPAAFEGDGTQLFGDRTTPAGDPFEPGAADSLGVRLTLSDPPRVRLTLNSWGGGVVSFTPECGNGVLIGSPPGTTLVISLQKREHPG